MKERCRSSSISQAGDSNWPEPTTSTRAAIFTRLQRILNFLGGVKSGAPGLQVPVYSHDVYDILPGRFQSMNQPDIVIFEGLNVLQAVLGAASVASDYFDFSIYLDAETPAIERWHIERFMLLQRTIFQRPSSYFHHYKDLSAEEAEATARTIWREINLPNLQENIRPTRERARLVVRKDPSHAVNEIWLRRS